MRTGQITLSFLAILTLWAALLGGLGCDTITAPTFDVEPSPGDNRAPTLGGVDEVAVVEAVEVSFSLEAADPDEGQTVTVSLRDGPEGATFDPATLTFTWTPPLSAVTWEEGSVEFAVNFVAVDSFEPAMETSHRVTLMVASNVDGDAFADTEDPDIDGDGLSNDQEDALGTARHLADTDGDGTNDGEDNCPVLENIDQLDTDGDLAGEVCDVCPDDPANDDDKDGVCGDIDNCAGLKNDDQLDTDGDGAGDACDVCIDDADDDIDKDGWCADEDNCDIVKNDDQADTDEDGLGDLCDVCDQDPNNDEDSDEICGDVDNCPTVSNFDQLDDDIDKVGNACDNCPDEFGADPDEDTICGLDNCPHVKNQDQADEDNDGVGDACDPCLGDMGNDPDEDGICAADDNCPLITNLDQSDGDNDLVGDACDPCPNDEQNDIDDDGFCADVDNCPGLSNDQSDIDGDQLGDDCDPDIDGDGKGNGEDNCPEAANLDQTDLDGDGQGDACDGDIDGDLVENAVDNCPSVVNADQLSMDGDALGLACDPFVQLPPSVAPTAASTIALGHASGNTVAVGLVEPGDAASVFVIGAGGASSYTKKDWVTIGASGAFEVPFVGPDGVVYFRGRNQGGIVQFDRVTGSTLAPVWSSALTGIPILETSPDGTTVGLAAPATAGIYSLSGSSPPALVEPGNNWIDIGGTGPVRDSQGALYVPVTALGGNVSLVRFTASGADASLTGLIEIAFVASDPVDGGVWYCLHGGQTTFAKYLNGAQIVGTTVSGTGGCNGLSFARSDADSSWWITGGTGNAVRHWTPGVGPVVTLLNNIQDAKVHPAGGDVYVTSSCAGVGCTRIYHSTGAALTEIGEMAVHFPRVDVDDTGRFIIAGRDNAVGAAQIVAGIGISGVWFETVVVAESTSPVVQSLGWTSNGIAWMRNQVKVAANNQRWVSSVTIDSGNVRVTEQHAIINTALNVSDFSDVPGLSKYSVVSWDGESAGLYLAAKNTNGDVELSLLAAAVEAHVTAVELPNGVYGDRAWLAYPKSDGWAVATLTGPELAPQLNELLTGLDGAPIDTTSQSGDSWLGFAKVAKEGFARLTPEGALQIWKDDKADVSPIYERGGDGPLVGISYKDSLSAPPRFCALPPASACWSLPPGNLQLRWGPYVTGSGAAFAVVRDGGTGGHYIWRNIEEPVDDPDAFAP